MNCTTTNCDKKILCKGLCSKCYYRVKRGGTPELSKRQQQALRKCDFLNCAASHHAKGLCETHYMAKQRAENPELRMRNVEQTRSWRKTNPEMLAAQQIRYRLKHKNELKTYLAQWKKGNKLQYNAYLATRKKRVRQATPKNEDLNVIEQFYLNCPDGYHVDHIVPLTGKNVCGLHTLRNLQYLTVLENLRKGNKAA